VEQRGGSTKAASNSLKPVAPTIRTYRSTDSVSIVTICRASPEAAQWSKESYDRAESLGQTIFVAEVAGRICGFLAARHTGGEVEILNMAVDEPNRRQGLGSALLTAAFNEAQSRHTQEIYLEVRESNRQGIAFYEMNGFIRTGKRTGYYRDPVENAVLMKKKLTG
jgi:ribosomal-protein-alanine acetyltransferase